MQQQISSACLLFIILIAGISCGPSKEEYRKDFVRGCVNSYAKDSSVASVEGRIVVEEYCNCLGDQLNAQMNADQWRTFNKSGDTLMTQYRSYIEPCIEHFHNSKNALPH